MILRRTFTIAGIVLILAGLLLGVISSRGRRARATDRGRQLFAQLNTAEDAALLATSSSPLNVRRAFLTQALSSDADVQQILRRQHAISIALSRIDFADAQDLYREVLRARLLDTPSPDVLEACMILLTRWDLVPEVSTADADHIATRLAERMEAEARKGAPARYAPAIDTLAGRLTSNAADLLATRLFHLAVSVDPGNAYDAVQAVAALASRTSAARRRDLATTLATRLVATTARRPIVVLAPMLAPLAAGADENESAGIASQITQRILTEFDASEIDMLLPPLRVVAEKVAPAEAERDGRLILSHIEFEMQPTVLFSLTQALNSFGDRVSIGIYRAAAESLLKRIRVETDETSLTMLTASLGVLNHKATGEQFTEAANRIVGRFSAARDMMADAALAGAIDAVADELAPPVAERLSSLLVARMLEEQRLGPLLYTAVGLTSMADEVGRTDANELSGRLLARMKRESNPNVLRTLAFSIAAFTNANANGNEAAAVLVSRIGEVDDPDNVRKLASGVYGLRNKANAKYLDQAANAIAHDIEAQIKPDEVAELTASLHPFAGIAGPEPFERAATAIVANVRETAALEPSLREIAFKVREPKARELVRTLSERMTAEQDPATQRALADSIADFGNTPPMEASCPPAQPKLVVLNPLCSEAIWTARAADMLHVKMPVHDAVAPDFAQLADDDDDDAPPPQGNEEPLLDFRKLSDVLTKEQARPAIPQEPAIPWAAIAVAACGVASLSAAWVVRGRLHF